MSVTVATRHLDRIAAAPEVSYAVRAWSLALARMDRAGVAEFEPGELGRLLRYPGEDAPVPRASVLKALGRAQGLGLIRGHESTMAVWLDVSEVRSHDTGWSLP